MQKDCNGEFATEKQKITSLEKALYGNGTNGLMRIVKKLNDDMIIQKERNSFKMWVYRGVIGVLITMITFLATRAYYTKFGG